MKWYDRRHGWRGPLTNKIKNPNWETKIKDLKKVLVTGGCGYMGSVLIPKLLNKGYFVVCLDTQWFGCYLKERSNLQIIKTDLRNFDFLNFKRVFYSPVLNMQ